MKKRLKTKKRKTLPQLLLKALLCTAFLTVIFVFCFQEFLMQVIHKQAEQQNDHIAADMQQRIGQAAAKYDGDILMQEIRCQLSIYQYYEILIDDPLAREGKEAFVSSGFSPKCSKGAALIGKDGSIAAINEAAFMTHLSFSAEEDDPAKGWYICDRKALNLPEVDSFYEDYLALASQETLYNMLDIEMETAYVNKKTHSYIPQKGAMYLKEYPEKTDPLIEDSQIKTLETKEINITVDLPGYELMTLHRYAKDAEYPRALLNSPQGEIPEALEQYRPLFAYQDEKNYFSGGFHGNPDDTETYYKRIPLWIDGNPYQLVLCFTLNLRDSTLVAFYWRWTVTFALVVLIAALLLCWRDLVVSRAKYAMEDYQRDLTNHLAHDIKTPLTAIGGYAENLMEGKLTAEEQQRYLQSILDNVSFTDSLVRQTLSLNSMDGTQKPQREQINVRAVIEGTFAKYALMLEEKQIAYGVGGEAEISADRAMFTTVIENLISNAVKYTPEGGTVKAALSKKRLELTNTVAEQLDTRKLKQPFYRGDKARSNADGAGLGLSIAERAANANGFTLHISCTDSEFKAEVRF